MLPFVSSLGGPRVLLPTSDVERWMGELGDEPNPQGGLYGLACSTNDYCGVISPWGTPLLVFGDAPSDIYRFDADRQGISLVRWEAANSLEDLLTFARQVRDEGRWDEVVEWEAEGTAYSLIDTCNGAGQGRMDLTLQPGRYQVQTRYAEATSVWAVVHLLVLKTR